MRRHRYLDGPRTVLRLADGRKLAFQTAGDPTGVPIIYFHGTPSSSVERHLFGTDAELRSAGIRLIAPDRPGVGGSSFLAGRRVVDWPADVTALTDRLELDRFAILGYSGGSPYAHACAALIPDRLSAVTVVSGTAPFEVPGVADEINAESRAFMELSRRRPRFSRIISGAMGLVARFMPDQLAARAAGALPPPDARQLEDPRLGRLFSTMVYETTHGSAHGAQHETALMISPWRFDPSETRIPIRLWHGTEDRNAPPAMARHLESILPAATLTWLEGEGHISTPVRHGPAILADLRERAVAAAA